MARTILPLFALLSALGVQAADLTIAAASDLAPLESALKKAYGGGIRFSFGSSGSLLRQIENGAPFDVYLSANDECVAEGIATRVLASPARPYATGRVALWSKSGDIRTLADLRVPTVLHVAIANPAHAPYGAAARLALTQAGLWTVLKPKLVYGENVRQAMQYAESGNADAAIVAWTLVHNRGGLLLPGAEVRQAGAVVERSTQKQAARRFLDWLLSDAGQVVLRSNGLFPPSR